MKKDIDYAIWILTNEIRNQEELYYNDLSTSETKKRIKENLLSLGSAIKQIKTLK
jgi:hypothetical protein